MQCMRPLGLDAVGLNNLLERMFNNEPAVRHISPNDSTGRTLTNVLLNDTALTLMDRDDKAAGMMYQVMGQIGLIVGVSDKGLDGLSRSLFIQARTRQEGDADDPQAKAGRIFTFHRKRYRSRTRGDTNQESEGQLGSQPRSRKPA